jgi:hypothetical protein
LATRWDIAALATRWDIAALATRWDIAAFGCAGSFVEAARRMGSQRIGSKRTTAVGVSSADD